MKGIWKLISNEVDYCSLFREKVGVGFNLCLFLVVVNIDIFMLILSIIFFSNSYLF